MAAPLSEKYLFELFRTASSAREQAYAPYSGYKVGAVILAESGKIYDGANIENAVYRGTHAEKYALDHAVKEGERRFRALLIVTDDITVPFPCGQCLQDLSEFDIDGKGELEIISQNLNGFRKRAYLKELLPERFGPKDIGIDVEMY